jgi:uncharacterized membrane protein
MTGLYIFWTPLQDKVVQGLQGRYFIPIIPPITLLFYNNRFRSPEWLKYPLVLTLVMIWTVTFRVVLARYYGI